MFTEPGMSLYQRVGDTSTDGIDTELDQPPTNSDKLLGHRTKRHSEQLKLVWQLTSCQLP